MKKIEEAIRLKYEAGLSNQAIASACQISNSTVGEYLKQAEAAGLSWPIAADEAISLADRLPPETEPTPLREHAALYRACHQRR